MKNLIFTLVIFSTFMNMTYAQGQTLPAGYSAGFIGVNTNLSSLAGYADVHIGYSIKGAVDIGASYQLKGMNDTDDQINALSGFINLHILRQAYISPFNLSIGAAYSNLVNRGNSTIPAHPFHQNMNAHAAISRTIGDRSFFFLQPTIKAYVMQAANPFNTDYNHKSIQHHAGQLNYELEFSVPIVFGALQKQLSLEPKINRSNIGMTYGMSINFFLMKEATACVRKRRLKSRGRNW